MPSDLKEKSISGMIWNSVERFGSSLFLFIANLVLARLLSPDDFGIIAMLMVFISIAEAIVDAGFSSALIQKRETNEIDCSTMFIWNISFSTFLYVLIFFSAPYIACFYNMNQLTYVLRIQGLIIPLNGLTLVHIALLKKQLNFKKIAKINLAAIVIGTIVGIASAYFGAGVWSLVIKLLLTALVQVLMYYGMNYWWPSWTFDYSRFKTMLNFGMFVFVNQIVNTLYHNLLALIIGKFFTAATLGYYNQARKLEDLPRSALSSTVTNVAFPAFSKINNNLSVFKTTASRCLRSLTFLSFPLMALSIVIAKPLILILFTSKWDQTIPYFQLFCMAGMMVTPLEINTQFLNALGKSRITFLSRVLMCFLGLCIILTCTKWGMCGLLIAYVASQFVGFAVSAFFSGKYFGYGFLRQLWEMLPFVMLSIIAGVVAYIFALIPAITNSVCLLLSQITSFIITYIMLSHLFRIKEVVVYKDILKDRLLKFQK